jgi:lysophospholipase L1-like esterase
MQQNLLFFILLLWNVNAMSQNQKEMEKRMLALGDSYTIGESVQENERWPMQLVEMLGEAGNNFEKPEIIAKTGWTTDELIAAINEANPQGPFDLVSLLIGVNNQYRGNSLSTYREEFEFLLRKAIDFAGGDIKKVIVVSIPDWGVTPFAEGRDREKIAQEIDAFNEANEQITESLGVTYVEITKDSKLAATDLSLIASDGLHPSSKMYKHWASLVFKSIP